MTAAELGDLLDLHPTTVRFHLDQLVSGGLLRSQFVRSGGAGRPAKRYAVEEGELSSLTQPRAEGPYQVLATLLAEALAQDGAERTTPEEAGREWALRRLAAATTPLAPSPEPASTPGGWVGKVGLVLDLLQEWGYHPDLQVGVVAPLLEQVEDEADLAHPPPGGARRLRARGERGRRRGEPAQRPLATRLLRGRPLGTVLSQRLGQQGGEHLVGALGPGLGEAGQLPLLHRVPLGRAPGPAAAHELAAQKPAGDQLVEVEADRRRVQVEEVAELGSRHPLLSGGACLLYTSPSPRD